MQSCQQNTSTNNVLNTPVSRRAALGAAAVATVAAISPKAAHADESDSTDAMYESEPIENSWRYENGERIDLNEEGNSDIAPAAGWTPWGKNGSGQWVNSQGTPIPGALYRGIDVSAWNYTIDWDTVNKSDVDFAIIRAARYVGTYNGLPGKDEYWERNASECERLGIPYGAYIYSYAKNVAQAIEEADFLLSLVRGHIPDYPLYIDMEDKKTLGADHNAIALAFCQRIEAAGYQAGVYANLNWWRNYLTSSSLNAYSRWVAQYNIRCDYNGSYDIWQASSSASVAGISGRVDINFDIAGLIPEDDSNVDSAAMYRLYNPNSGEHFYTASSVERNTLRRAGWIYEGIAWYAPKQGDPVYRLYNPVAGDHHYTPFASERDMLKRAGWIYEGIAWQSSSSSSAPVLRLYNPNAWTGTHHYTLSEVERNNLTNKGWIYEGVGWYAV